MLTILEILMIVANFLAIVYLLLPVKSIPRFIDFMPLAAIVFLILHLFIDNEPVVLRFIPLYTFTIIMFLITLVRIFKPNHNEPKRNTLSVIRHIFSLIGLIICILIPTIIIPFYSLPGPTGEYNVGTVITDIVDENRLESFSKEEGELRKIAVQFWYPTDRTGSEVMYDISGAPISTGQEIYPVLIFSHGAFGVRMSNASAFRELASHGYIVASIDHTYHSFYTSFQDGEIVIVNNEFINNAIGVTAGDISGDETFKITHEWLDLRTADVELVIDSLKSGELGTSGEILKGHMDFNRIGLFGHSLGGASSAQVAREREDVKAAIILDGTMIGDIIGVNNDNTEILTDESFNKPLMQMYNSEFLNAEYRKGNYSPNINAYENGTHASYSLCIKDSGHLNFTDLPRISPFLSERLGIGTIDSLKCIKIVNAYTLAFFEKHLKGESSSLIEGVTVFNEVIFEQKIPEGE